MKKFRNFDLEDDKTFDKIAPFFNANLKAMTDEDLTGNASIAWELAYRDSQIAELTSELSKVKKEYPPEVVSLISKLVSLMNQAETVTQEDIVKIISEWDKERINGDC